MVYAGKPSLGCDRCRGRRIKCDEQRPKCGLCTRNCHACHYRNVTKMIFRDQTSHIISKSHTAKPRAKWRVNSTITGGSSSSSSTTGCDLQRQSGDWDELNILRLSQSYSDVAIHQWLTKYVQGSHLGFLATSYPTNALKEPFRSAMTAVALASFANEVGWQPLSGMAQLHYNKAIKQTQKLIEDPEKAQSDDTLATVLLLSSFETVSTDTATGAENWSRHVRGAHAMLVARGCASLGDPLAKRLFMQVASSITLDCLQSRTRVPRSIQQMMASLAVSDVPDVRQSFQRIVSDLIDLRASLAEGSLSNPPQIVFVAALLDGNARACEVSMQSHADYAYNILPNPLSPDDRGAVQHLYSSTGATLLWNSLRMLRIFTNDIILSYTPLCAGEHFARLKDKACATISSICVDICASISLTVDLKGIHNTTHSMEHVAAANFAIWPLFTAGSSRSAAPAVRDCALHMLRDLGQKYHVRRALAAAEQLKQGDRNDGWMHLNFMF